ncbi:MAG: hypothetical protein II323_03990 [Tidjanibacter sp.]|nr:hypothetical protein [Tidjanibacter sp.]
MWLDKHLRHRRGYGIHSPYLYRIIREGLMLRKINGTQRDLFEELREKGVGRRTAIRLQNLCKLEDFESWAIDGCADCRSLLVATEHCPIELVEQMMASATANSSTLVLLHSAFNCQRRRECRVLAEKHHSMSASNLQMTLLFNAAGLTKQHIVI